MKLNLEKKYQQIALTAFLVIAASVLFYYAIFHLKNLVGGIRFVLGILSPIIYGAVIAYLLTPIVNFLEVRVFAWIFEKNQVTLQEKGKRVIRWVSVIIALVVFLLLIFGIMMLIIPQVVRSIIGLINSIPEYSQVVQEWLQTDLKDLLRQHPDIYESIMGMVEEGGQFATENFLPRAESLLTQLTSGISGVISFAKNFLIGAVISIYLMADKERFIARGKMLMYALLPETRTDNLIRSLRYTHKTFGGFISGKILDSAIIGVLCYIGCSIMDMPYTVLISVVIGVTNFIPFFGPIIGAVPTFFLILLVDPVKSLYFLIFVLILQQFDGNILGPKILGDSTGMSSFMVIVAILIGGGLFGVVGMAVGVPILAVIRTSLWHRVGDRLEKKELPSKLEEYTSIDRIDLETRTPLPMQIEEKKVSTVRKGVFMILWNAVMRVILPVWNYLKKGFIFIISRLFYYTVKLIRAIRKNGPVLLGKIRSGMSGMRKKVKTEMDNKKAADELKKEEKKNEIR